MHAAHSAAAFFYKEKMALKVSANGEADAAVTCALLRLAAAMGDGACSNWIEVGVRAHKTVTLNGHICIYIWSSPTPTRDKNYCAGLAVAASPSTRM